MAAEIGEALKADVAVGAYRNSLVLFGNFALRDGSWSPFYMDVRPIPSVSENPDRTDMSRSDQLQFRANVVGAYSLLLDQVEPYCHIQSIPEATNALIGMVGYAHGDSVLNRRVKPKAHGNKAEIMGHYKPGDITVLLDDVITTSGAKVDEKNLIEDGSKVRDDDDNVVQEGLIVNDAVIMLDREQGGIEKAREGGLNVLAALTLTELIEISYAEGAMIRQAYEIIQGFRSGEITDPKDLGSKWPPRQELFVRTPLQLTRDISGGRIYG